MGESPQNQLSRGLTLFNEATNDPDRLGLALLAIHGVWDLVGGRQHSGCQDGEDYDIFLSHMALLQTEVQRGFPYRGTRVELKRFLDAVVCVTDDVFGYNDIDIYNDRFPYGAEWEGG